MLMLPKMHTTSENHGGSIYVVIFYEMQEKHACIGRRQESLAKMIYFDQQYLAILYVCNAPMKLESQMLVIAIRCPGRGLRQRLWMAMGIDVPGHSMAILDCHISLSDLPDSFFFMGDLGTSSLGAINKNTHCKININY